jgi:putative transposase
MQAGFAWVVNHKKVKRLMSQHGLQPPLRRRYAATTDSNHDQPILADRTRELTVDGPDQLWVADLTYITVAVGFVYLALIMDAWSRRIVGYAIGRRIDAASPWPLWMPTSPSVIRRRAASTTPTADRNSPPGYLDRLVDHHLVGSMGRRGNPYDNAMMESLMKTLKVEGVYPMAFESFEEVAEHLPRFIEKYNPVS